MSTDERNSTLKLLTRGLVLIASLFGAVILTIVLLFTSKSAQIKVDYYKDNDAIVEYQEQIKEKEMVIDNLFDSIAITKATLKSEQLSNKKKDSTLEVNTLTLKKLNEKISSLSDSIIRSKRTRVSDLESVR